MDRTKTTEAFYMKKARSLCRAFQKSHRQDWSEDPLGFCRWLEGQKKGWSPATWRVCKASVLLLFEIAEEYQAMEYLKEVSTEGCDRTTRRTSAQKAKYISTDDIFKILEVLNKKENDYSVLLGLWLVCNRLVGLRPTEWVNARLEGDTLVVKNAKNTNGRSHGEIRRLHLDKMSQDNKAIIRSFMEMMETLKEKHTPQQIYKTCRESLRRLTRKLWPDRKEYPTLYSGRHQFSADLKKAGYSLEEIAALFGHATNRTATEHYGKALFGEKETRTVEADPEDVQRVRKVYQPSVRPTKSEPEEKL